MNLYLLRHGIAVERRAGLPDGRRKLTPRGVRRIRKIALAMQLMHVRIDRIFSSPYERARRTAAIVADTLGVEWSEVNALRPGGDPRAAIAAVRAHGSRNVLLVGHEPMLSQLVSVLLTGAPGATLRVKKGGLCKLRVTNLHFGACAALEWLLAPRHMLRVR